MTTLIFPNYSFAVLILFILENVYCDDVIVNTNAGQVKGFIDKDIDGNPFYSFLGIPYGKAPEGELRFKPPLPVEPWNGVYDCTKKRNQCVQYNYIMKSYTGKEDCLNLNVFSRSITKTNNLKPVMLFIHGGGFSFGSNWPNLYGAKFLLSEDVVYVATNYRLGLFGGLFFEDSSLGITGNMGFKDIILALKWIQANIANFNGDPDNVTIFGASAGSASVHLLMLSPMAKGLFHRAIMQSGVALNPWAQAYNKIPELKNASGHVDDTDQQFLQYLRDMNPKDVAVLYRQFDHFAPHITRPAGYTIEKPDADQPFLTQEPIDIILSGNFNDVPMIIGFVDEEGCVIPFLNSEPIENFNAPRENPEDEVPAFLNLTYGSPESKALGQELYDEYFGPSKISTKFCQLNSDVNFNTGIYATAVKHTQKAKSSVYYYLITMNTKLNILKKMMKAKHIPGTMHYDDIGYLFSGILVPPITPDSEEYAAMKRHVKMWTTFARTGNPTTSLNIEWKPMEKNRVNVLNIGKELQMIDDSGPIFATIKYTNQLFGKYPIGAKIFL